MSFMDFIQVIGLFLGLGAALDFAVRKKAKRLFIDWVSRVSMPRSGYSYQGSILMDRLFGPTLFGKRAVISYVSLCIASIAISYGIAIATSPSELFAKDIAIFAGSPTPLELTILAICIGFAILGDIASYAQTRLFIRAVDQYKNGVVSVGLGIADIITSLSLFFISFSFARIIIYVLVINFSSVPLLNSSDTFLPGQIQSIMGDKTLFGEINPSLMSPASTLALRVSVSTSEEELASLAQFYRLNEASRLTQRDLLDSATYSASLDCPKDLRALVAAQANTTSLLTSIAEELNESQFSKIDLTRVDEAGERFVTEVAMSGDECSQKVLTISRTMPISSIVVIAGFGNSYLAAAERTMFDAYQVVAFKLAPYVYFDPFADVSDFMFSLQTQVEQTFLGASAPDYDRVEVLSHFTSNPPAAVGRAHVPFSPMVASSLSSSMIFFVYISAVGLSILRRTLIERLKTVAPRFDFDNAAFTTFALALVVVLTLIQVVGILAEAFWSGIF
jgi:hypothetical protein